MSAGTYLLVIAAMVTAAHESVSEANEIPLTGLCLSQSMQFLIHATPRSCGVGQGP